jgi:DNA-binding beta-propeller fold protein YncE
VDGAGNLYFTDSVSNQIVKETIFPNGTGTRTVVPITGLSTPRGIAVDTQGNLYIADYGNNRGGRSHAIGKHLHPTHGAYQ